MKNEFENMKRKMVKRMIMMKMSKELMNMMMMKILIRGYVLMFNNFSDVLV